MFKFLKDSFNEGREEARQEALKEERDSEQEREEILRRISALPEVEVFGCSLAAPFRASALQVWFTIFNKDREALDENVVPFPLFSFGSDDFLTAEQQEALKKQFTQSFSVTDPEEVLLMVKEFLGYINLDLVSLEELDLSENRRFPESEIVDIRLDAWLLSAAASLLTAGVQFEGVSKEKALMVFAELLPVVREKYPNWSLFAKDFIAQEKRTKINGRRTQKRLERDVSYLTYKAGSPWVMFPLEEYQ